VRSRRFDRLAPPETPVHRLSKQRQSGSPRPTQEHCPNPPPRPSVAVSRIMSSDRRLGAPGPPRRSVDTPVTPLCLYRVTPGRTAWRWWWRVASNRGVNLTPISSAAWTC
jgi:hypothetical protein